jgi:hypothetical protein
MSAAGSGSRKSKNGNGRGTRRNKVKTTAPTLSEIDDAPIHYQIKGHESVHDLLNDNPRFSKKVREFIKDVREELGEKGQSQRDLDPIFKLFLLRVIMEELHM